MERSLPAFLLVQGVTVSRIIAAILIGALAQHGTPFILGLYIFALASDFLDGFLARRLGVSSALGHALDLIADKLLTAVSL
ncbi:MAG TPA: CDP-alcohol phosphatidyltransferase family protein, partial [Allosphingosinicella sp.]